VKNRPNPNEEGQAPGRISVFVSHSSKDRPTALRFCELLEKQGIRCWIAPRDVTPGDAYGAQIVRGIEEAAALVLVLSRDSNTSRHVESEVARAFEKGKRIYPVRIDEIMPSEGLELFVTSAHWVEAWEHGIQKAVEEVAEALRTEPKPGKRKAIPGVQPKVRRPSAMIGLVLLILLLGFLGYLGFLAFLVRQPEEREKYMAKMQILLTMIGLRKPEPPPEPLLRGVPVAVETASVVEVAAPTRSPDPGPDGPETWRVHDPHLQFVWIPALGLYAGKHEVTNRQFLRFKPDHWSGMYGGRRLDEPTQPVVRVSHAEAESFAEWLTARERKSGDLPKAWQFRIPTKQEWQELARCGDDRKYAWGDEWPPPHGNLADRSLLLARATAGCIEKYHDGYPVSSPVDNSATNKWGIQGMAGNVREWARGDAGAEAVVCGAEWDCHMPALAECSTCVPHEADTRHVSLGFRLILAPVGP